MREKRYSRRQLVAAALLTAAATAGTLVLALWMAVGTGGFAMIEALTLVNYCFVGELDRQAVADSALAGMVQGLGDRWSYYLDKEWYDSEKLRRENAYVGIGVTVSYEREEGLLIRGTADEGPAQRAGLQPGEIITVADGQSLAGEARYGAKELLQGEQGSRITLEILGTDGRTRSVAVTREAVKSSPVSYEMLKEGVGYIKVANFNARSAQDIKAAVEALQEQGAYALLFDVRNNGGGYLEELTDILDYLLPEGPIFRMCSRYGREKVYESDADYVDLPMAVLVNGKSYSAAELFAAQLQESGAAVVVGSQTSGKGYSQVTFPILGGGGLGLSVNEYTTGGGVSLVGTGIAPDRTVELDEEAAALLAAGALPHGQDAQIQTALVLLEGEGSAEDGRGGRDRPC